MNNFLTKLKDPVIASSLFGAFVIFIMSTLRLFDVPTLLVDQASLIVALLSSILTMTGITYNPNEKNK